MIRAARGVASLGRRRGDGGERARGRCEPVRARGARHRQSRRGRARRGRARPARGRDDRAGAGIPAQIEAAVELAGSGLAVAIREAGNRSEGRTVEARRSPPSRWTRGCATRSIRGASKPRRRLPRQRHPRQRRARGGPRRRAGARVAAVARRSPVGRRRLRGDLLERRHVVARVRRGGVPGHRRRVPGAARPLRDAVDARPRRPPRTAATSRCSRRRRRPGARARHASRPRSGSASAR